MTRFWWVRHGPTHARAFAGWRDIPADLSDTAALDRLHDHLPKDAILVSSDLIRAACTADALAHTRERIAHMPALREFHFGDWDGLGFEEVSTRWPDQSRLYWEEPGHTAPPNGESWLTAAARVETAVQSLIALYPGREIVAVAHFGVILTQYQRAAGLTAYQALGQKIDNLSVTCLGHRIGASGDEWSVEAVNHIP
jgi:broad specificity phosphatase PhoE